jgi:hypothetical protein
MEKDMSIEAHRNRSWARRVRVALIVACAALAWPIIAQSPQPDLCGCRDNPNSLGAFDLRDKNTWPPGTTVNGRFVTVPLPADGVLVFDSIFLDWNSQVIPSCCPVEVGFAPNAANTPVTLLVKGNVTINQNAILEVKGSDGGFGNANTFGVGGLGGNGGFRGGDGAYRLQNNSADGGIGLGPGGGLPGTAVPSTPAGAATFVGAIDLLPLVGGSGGGGGRAPTASTGCSAGGGGGGGGGLLLALNGTLTANSTSGAITADGGNGGGAVGFATCTGGHGGSGGAIRIIANTITGGGRFFARGGTRWEDGIRSGAGAVRMEALSNNFNVTFVDPIASRTTTPGPITNPFTPKVAVTAVAGQPVGDTPQGAYGGIDIQVPVPGPTTVDLATDGVPTGTTLEVKVKPRIGTGTTAQTFTLVNCDGSGRCLASATFDLAAGQYAVEARATFQTP